jgi:peptidoglycan-associated lipoprotein
MTELSWKNRKILLVGLIAPALLVGCSSRTVTTSAEDQNRLQRQGSVMPGTTSKTPTDVEAERITEPIIAALESPSVRQEKSSQPSIPSPSAVSAVLPGRIGDVYFDYDRFALRNDARTTLEKNALWLKSQNGVKFLIEGHCDERGTLAYNLVLGERRAQSVKRYLRELGVASSRLQIVSYGKERPFCTEHLEACWQQNRRGHFVVN